jgi:cell division protein FtsL
MPKQANQAFKQAPWRTQLRSVGLILLILAIVVVVAGLYLSVSAQAAEAGLEIQKLETDKDKLQQQIADLSTFLAWMDSATKMEERARALGFQRITADQAVYVAVPGYTGRTPISVAQFVGTSRTSEDLIKPIYTQSLWDWMFAGISSVK